MALLSPAGLWVLALIPPIVLLYFMKLRRQEVRVPAGFLWQRALQQARSESFFERLKVNLLLLLQILVVIMLALALARPYRNTVGQMPAHAILVIDRSASMQAGTKETRFEQARRLARQMVSEAPPGTSFMVISATTRARVEMPFSDDREAVAKLLDGLTPLDTATRLEPALRLALSLSRQFGDAEIDVLSDVNPLAPTTDDDALDATTRRELEARTRLIGVGSRGRNVAVTALEARRASAGGRFEVLASVVSATDEPTHGFLELHRGGKLVDARQVELAARGHRDYIFQLDERGDADLEARLSLPDDLEVDNHAYTVLPAAADTRILLVTAGNPFLEKALGLLPGAHVFRIAPDEFRSSQAYALTVWDNVDPPADLHGNHLVIHPPGSTLVGPAGDEKGPFTVSSEAAHPLFRYLDWSRVHVAALRSMTVPSWGSVVARAGTKPVVAVLERGDLRAVVIGFDLFASDLPLSPVFPIFLSNALTWLTGGGMAGAPAHVAAEAPIALDFLRAGEPVVVTLPDGKTITLDNKSSGLTFSKTDRQGIYTFTQKDRVQQIAVNIGSAREADLTLSGSDATQAPQAARASEQPRIAEYGWVALLAALMLMMGEWYAYHQRR